MSASATRSFLLSSNSRVIKRVVSFCCSSASCEQRGELWRDFYLRHKAAQNRRNRKLLHVHCGGLFHWAEERTAAACRVKSAAVSTRRQTVGVHEEADICQTHVITSDGRTGSTAFSECVWHRNLLKQTNKHQNKSRQRREKSPWTRTRTRTSRQIQRNKIKRPKSRHLNGHVFIFSFQSLLLQVPERLGSVQEQIVTGLNNSFVTFLTVSISRLL